MTAGSDPKARDALSKRKPLPEPKHARARIAVDIGGTFTDVVLVDVNGKTWERKVATTVHDFTLGVVEGVREVMADANVQPLEISDVVHATTIGTNAVLSGLGPRVGLLTTEGFRDVLEIARIRTPTLYDLTWQKPKSLVPRRHRLEVRERITADGTVVTPLDVESVRRAARRLISDGVNSVAVCLINSYIDPRHEREVKAILAAEFPELSVCISADVLPQIKEYERTSTTVINAYLQPVMRGYLESLRERLAQIGLDVPIQVMRSDGGTMAATAAAERPIFVVGSGPAAGVTASRHFASRLGLADVIAFDMGGTTAKASVIEGGRFSIANEYEIRGGLTAPSRFIKSGGYLMMVPTIDLAEIGNGAGSIARVDAGGALRVGPESAGADPGPVCYAQGGTEPTITDANVVLGLLNPDSLLAGALRIDASRAAQAITDVVGSRLGLNLPDAAYGIHAIANSNMLRALRAVTTERGRDPRGFNLCAFGGSGPVHIAALAAELGASKVLVPPLAGLFSAVGLLASAVEHQYSRTWIRPLADVAVEQLVERFTDLEALASDAMTTEGYGADVVTLERLADLRYAGQSAVLTLPLKFHDWISAKSLIEDHFSEEHERTYGHRLLREPVELVGLRVIATAHPRTHAATTYGNRNGGHVRDRKVYWGPSVAYTMVPVIKNRAQLDGRSRQGPIIIEEYDTTTVVRPVDRVSLRDENIVIEVGQ